MGIIKTKGIVILESNMGDFDKMVTILTPNMGKIGCAARGSRRPKSALMAGTQYLSFSDFIVYSSPTSYSINSCDTIEVFYNIRKDINKLMYASFITKLVYDVTDENQYTYNILQLLLNTLYMISESDKNLDLILSVFELRLMVYLGFAPQLSKCTNCGNTENIAYFSIRSNGYECTNCGKSDKAAIRISQDTFNSLKYIISAPAKKIYSFSVSDEAIKELKLISSLYINDKLDKNYQPPKII